MGAFFTKKREKKQEQKDTAGKSNTIQGVSGNPSLYNKYHDWLQ